MANDIPVSADYTSRDFYALREELIARVQNRIPDWTGTDNNDFAMALIEAFAYMGDVSNYYIDRLANEAYLDTAVQRDTLLAIAERYGYQVKGYSNASLIVTFYNTSTSSVLIPAGTQVSGQVVVNNATQDVVFTTIADTTVPASDGTSAGTITTVATEGISSTVAANNSYGPIIGTSDGTAEQNFQIQDFPVVYNSVVVWVQSGSTYKKWTSVTHLQDYGPNDSVYTTYLDSQNNMYIKFGDGISGAIPTINATIRAVYTVGGGTIGNITTGVATTVKYVPGLSDSQTAALRGYITASNTTVGTGGADPESNDSIRQNAPGVLRAQNRAITLDDYGSLARAVPNVLKANAVGSGWGSVTLYIAPDRTVTDSDPTPGLDSSGTPTAEWTNIQSAVQTYLSDKIMIGASVTITPPTYTPVTIALSYTYFPEYTQTAVETAIKDTLVSNFAYYYMNFGDYFTMQNIEYAIQQVPGVKTAKVTLLYKTGASSGLAALQAGAGEIFTISQTNLVLTLGS
jgi:Baseplate J-like protein